MFGMPLTVSAGIVGVVAAAAAWALTRSAFRDIDEPLRQWGYFAAIVAGMIAAGLVPAMLVLNCQATPDVVPTPFWKDGRVVFHAALVVLLTAAAATDLKACYITDSVTFPGMLLGVVGATIAGDLQIVHIWVDWNQEIPQLAGPYRPGWLSAHPHLHGFAWSMTGLIVGAGLTWLVRAVSGWLLRQEALGLGDVTLMGMIGSFLGWQPTVVAFLFAPLCALSVGLAVKLLGNRSYVPYGPYLSLSAVLVLFAWRWIWMLEFGLHEGALATDRTATFALRRLFGDGLSLTIIAAACVLGLVLLLGLSRLYRLIPVDRSRRTVVREDGP